MSGGLFALLDDVAAIARAAASSLDDVAAATGRASVSATGVVIDDAAVTPQYVRGLSPARELPVVWRIARGSLFNKLIIILPVLMVLSIWLPWLLTPLLMVGGAFLCFEGAESLVKLFKGEKQGEEHRDAEDEKTIVKSAIRTDLILSAEIMVISLSTINTDSIWTRLAVLVAVALLITALVYGAVGLLVKIDDIGLAMVATNKPRRVAVGQWLVNIMPSVMSFISIVGIFAMLWVGGHIILIGTHELGFSPIYDAVHFWELKAGLVAGVGGLLAWLTNTICSLILGVIIGVMIVLVLMPFHKKHVSESKRQKGSENSDTSTGEAGIPDTN